MLGPLITYVIATINIVLSPDSHLDNIVMLETTKCKLVGPCQETCFYRALTVKTVKVQNFKRLLTDKTILYQP